MFRKHLLSTAIVLAATYLSANTAVAQAPATVADFNNAIGRFQQLSEQGNWKKSEPHARQAYEMAKTLFSTDSQKLATLAHNYGVNLLQLKKRDKAKDVLQESIVWHEQAYGKQADQLVPVLIDFSTSLNRGKDVELKHKNLDRALAITAKNHGQDSALWGQRAIDIGVKLQSKTSLKKSQKLIKKGYNVLTKKLGPNAERVHYAAFQLGRIELAIGNTKNAVKFFDIALQGSLAAESSSAKLELATREFLAKALAMSGKDDAASSHIMKIAMGNSHEGNAEHRSLVQFPLKTASNVDKDGFVVVNFDIDEQGRVINPAVVERGGPGQLARAALTTIQKFRYIPAIQQGKPVKVMKQTHRFDYKAPKAASVTLISSPE